MKNPNFGGRRLRLIAITLVLSGLLSEFTHADVLYLRDGSRLSGQIVSTDTTGIIIATAFAGQLSVPLEALAGLSSDAAVAVQLGNEDRVRGQLQFDPANSEQRLIGTAFGDVTLDPATLVAVWPQGQSAPAIKQAERVFRTELAEVKAAHEKEITDYETRLSGFEDPWSGRLVAGLDGASGNSKKLQFKGRAEARRETAHDRLLLFAEGEMQEQQDVLTDKEIRLGMHVEHDLTPRWFAFARQDLEKDKFENLELRSETVGGIGYFLIRKPGHTWKARVGAGYQFESFEDGSNAMEGILPLGYDYLVDVNDWLRFTHDITVYPAFSDPIGDYRVDSELGLELPLGRGDNWKLRFALRHEYDKLPAAGARSLDTTYGANVVLDIP